MLNTPIKSELNSNKKPIIKMEHTFKTYGQGDSKIFALNDVSLEIFPGQVITVMGPSGSGKSTLMHMLGAMDSPSSNK
jgi:putative ABC transport system ATP-binding protein